MSFYVFLTLMKFGKNFLRQQEQYPAEWTRNCLNYHALKVFLKENIALSKSKNLNAGTAQPSQASLDDDAALRHSEVALDDTFSTQMQERLNLLQQETPEFIRKLDVECTKLDAFFTSETHALTDRHLKSAGDKDLLQVAMRLERFVFMNFTGVCKILKKHDKISGIRISETYLARLAGHAFYQSTGLATLKKSLIQNLAGVETAVLLSPASISSEKSNQASLFPPAAGLDSQKILVSMSGPHGTDIIGALLEVFAKFDIQIDDLMFSRLYHNVTCAMLVRVNTEDVRLYNELAVNARKWDADLNFEVHDAKETLPRSLQDAPYEGRTKYAATLLNQNGLSAAFLNQWTKLLLQFKISIESVKRLNEGLMCAMDLKLSIPAAVDVDKFRADLFQLSSKTGTDIALQPDDVFRRSKRLIVMDMDSTLIQQEVIDELAKHYGVVDKVSEITHRAMNGELDFKMSLALRVALLKDAPVSILQKVKQGLIFTDGAHFLCRALKKLGFKLAVISGGFMPLALHVKNELGLDYAFANNLRVSPDGKTFVGETMGPIVDGERKAELLEVIAQAESIGPEQVVAIGDGANDLYMLAAAGLGIAFNAKPRVQERARTRINQKSLRNVLYLLGYSDDDITTLTVDNK